MKATANNPSAPTRYKDATTRALDELQRRFNQHNAAGFSLGYVEAREIVSEVKREHQVAAVPAQDLATDLYEALRRSEAVDSRDHDLVNAAVTRYEASRNHSK